MAIAKQVVPLFFVAVALYFCQRALLSMPLSSKGGLIPPPQFVEHMAFGYNESFADSLWLRTIQDFEECSILKENPEKYYGEKAYKMPEELHVDDPRLDKEMIGHLKNTPRQKKDCIKGWAFTMMDAATNLSPRFSAPYLYGATALSVIMEDYDGAKVMFDKGVKNRPHDWSILYRAAYHYLFDRRELSTAADLLNRAGNEGAPLWVKSLASRLYTQAGQAELGLSLLQQHLKEIDNPVAIKEIKERIRLLEEKVKKSKTSP